MSGRGKPVHPPVANASLDLNGAQFSVLNSMRTGNMIIDMIIALLVPFFFKLIFSDSKQLLLRIYDFLFDRKPSEDECIREISFLSVGSSLTGRDHKNQLLQKAITLYLTEEMRLPFESRAQVSLTAFHDTSVGMGPIDKYNPLARYRLMWQPPENSWIQIEPGLEFQQRTKREGADEDEDDRGNLRPIQREMIIFELKTSKKDGPQQIDRFIERALSWYKQELLKMRDDARYMYTMISKSPSASIVSEMTSTKRGATGADNKGGMPYKRYKLSDQKTFKSLFFPEKESILKLLSDFQQKAGKYGVEGYPHKLGLLLHGPPGTGKTSLIKALAQHTGRSIINIPLARINTNQQLMDVMHDLRICVPGQDMAVPLTFKDVIFVIEDIDAASSIVHRREHEGSNLRLRKATVETTRSVPSSGFLTEKVTREMSTASDDEEASAAPKQNNVAQCSMAAGPAAEHGGTLPSLAVQPAMTSPPSLAPQLAMEADPNLSQPPAAIPFPPAAMPNRHVPSKMEHLLANGMPSLSSEAEANDTKSSLLAKLLSEEDELNLAGLLNVLDGVVDTPERILIMTSNHPERLDPALIRPGRIDKKIFLGYMQHSECKQMLAHYFTVEVTKEQDARIQAMLGGAKGLKMTPADMEQLCAEHSTVDDILDALATRCAPPMLVPSRSKG